MESDFISCLFTLFQTKVSHKADNGQKSGQTEDHICERTEWFCHGDKEQKYEKSEKFCFHPFEQCGKDSFLFIIFFHFNAPVVNKYKIIIPRYQAIFNHYADFSFDNHKNNGYAKSIKRSVIAMKKQDKSRFPQATDGTKVYKPHDVISAGQEYVVTDNYTASNGRVYNRQEQNAGWARKWVDENEK